MKKSSIPLLICLFISANSIYCQIDSLYLGLVPPGNTPIEFELETDPGYFASDRIAITADGKQIYFSETTGTDWSQCKVKYYTYSGGTWIGPVTLCSGNLFAPALINNDSMLILENIQSISYYSLINEGDFGDIVSMDETNHYLQQTDSNNIYSGRSGSIYVLSAQNEDSVFLSLGRPINMGSAGGFSVARDESFMIFMSNRDGAADLYISYNMNDRWTNPKNLGPAVNSDAHDDYGAYISADNKYLFFSRSAPPYTDGGIFWVDVEELLDSLRNTNFIPYILNPIPNQNDTLGNTFSYAIPDSTFFDDDTEDTLFISVKLNNGDELPGWLDYNPDTRILSGTPLITENINLKVTATDNEGANISDNFSIAISKPLNTNLYKESISEKSFVFPNPLNSRSCIFINNQKPSNLEIKVINTLGQIILTDNFNDELYPIGNRITENGLYLYFIIEDSKIISSGRMVKY